MLLIFNLLINIQEQTMKVRRFSTCDKINSIAKNLVKSGWIVKSCNKHPRLENPETKQCITVPSSSGDPRVLLNWIGQLKRTGVPVCY